MKCTVCANELVPGASYCSHCGSRVFQPIGSSTALAYDPALDATQVSYQPLPSPAAGEPISVRSPSNRFRNLGQISIIVLASLNVLLWIIFLPRASGRLNLTREVGGEMISSTAMVLFACALFLATRPRFLEPFFGGLDRMYQTHKRAAFTGFLLLFGHVFFVPINVNDPKAGDIFGIIAFLGIVFLVLLTVGPRVPLIGRFTRSAYHKWKLTHRFVGLFFILAGVHAMLVEPIIREIPVVFGYVVFFYLLGTGSYIYAQLIAPFVRRRFPYTVSNVRQINGSTAEITLEPNGKKMPYTAGQFLFVRFSGDPILGEAHPFTVSSSPRENAVRLSIKASGDFTRHLHATLKPGVGAFIEGAYGRFNYRHGGPSQIWIAGGIGITPFLSWVRDFDDGVRHDIDLFYTVRTPDEAFFRTELDVAGKRFKNMRVHPVFSSTDGSLNMDKIKARASGPLAEKDVYLCGPIAMTESFSAQFRKLGVPAKKIHFEEFNFR